MVTVDAPYGSTVERARLVFRDSQTTSLAGFRLRSGSWGGTLPGDTARVARLHLLDSGGRVLLSAYLPRSW